MSSFLNTGGTEEWEPEPGDTDDDLSLKGYGSRNCSPHGGYPPWVVCGGSVFGRDAKAQSIGRYWQRLPEQIAHGA
ncbi:MAG: hypothetical protein GY703_15010 [Gammaproteobacteria bacterium]|nr:hypothetical protein [Gammaproteobacteria bacterium]